MNGVEDQFNFFYLMLWESKDMVKNMGNLLFFVST